MTRRRTETRSEEPTLLHELSQEMLAVSTWMRHYHDTRFEQLGPTAASGRALLVLDPGTPVPTRDLADRLGCDPSNVTALVDRLEGVGFVERRMDPNDRRVKTLAITPKGQRMRDQMTALGADIPPLGSLTATEQRTLLELLHKVRAACAEFDARKSPLDSRESRAARRGRPRPQQE